MGQRKFERVNQADLSHWASRKARTFWQKPIFFPKNPLVEYAHPNFFARADFVPNDPFYCFQWHFDDSLEGTSTDLSCHELVGGNPFGGINGGGIGLEDAWDTTTGSSSVIVAILDSGVAYEDFSDSSPAGCYNIMGQLKKCQGKAIDTYFQAPDLAGTNFMILPGSDKVNGDDHPNDDTIGKRKVYRVLHCLGIEFTA